jgi:hypothetical protein
MWYLSVQSLQPRPIERSKQRRARRLKPLPGAKVSSFMADPFEVDPTRPIYRAIPVLEIADEQTSAIVDVLPVEQPAATSRRPRNPVRATLRLVLRGVRFAGSVLEWLFGCFALMVGLAVLAALPGLQLLSLGYLLEAGGRVARTGRLRDGFIGVRLAARLGGVVLSSWLLLLPVRLVAGLARSAQVIDPDGRAATGWRFALSGLIGLTALHIGAACSRGGRFRYFLWPFNVFWLLRRLVQGGYYTHARDVVWDTFAALRLPYYFWLGLRGFVGACVWLVLPISLLAQGQRPIPAGPLMGFLGGFLLAIVLLYLPFLQMRLAATNRFMEVFRLRAVRADFRRAPWAFALAFVVTLLFALPLYLLKIEIVPREAAWLPSLVFVSFIFPARLATGLALARAARRQTPRHWFFRWTGRLPLLPAAAFYVLVVFFTQYTSWNGVLSLYEQHAFLVPVPFLGL